ncbi:MAG: hypothetical protein ACE5HZ_00645 [Fidelibacterota bacterium]
MSRILPILVLTQALSGQDWDIVLSSGEELTGLDLQWVKRDSLVVGLDGASQDTQRTLPISHIHELRRVTVEKSGRDLAKRAALTLAGSVVGYGVGSLFYRLALPWLSNGNDDEDGPELRNVFVYSSALVGLMHGKNWPLAGSPDTVVYVLEGTSPSQDLRTVRRLTAPEEPRFFAWLGRMGNYLTGLEWYEWEVTLTSGQVYSHTNLVGLAGDSLRFHASPGSYRIPVRAIRRVTRNVSWGRYLPPVLGGLLGIYGGGVVGRVMSDKILELPAGSPVKPFPVVAGGILGTAAGARYVHGSGDLYDLSGLTDEEKAGVLKRYVLSGP